MNHDRLLTRVYDTQEKKMLYIKAYEDIKASAFHPEKGLIAINDKELIFVEKCLSVEAALISPTTTDHLSIKKIGDRFVPMQCTGRKDKNKKLIYYKWMVADKKAKKIYRNFRKNYKKENTHSDKGIR